jgi:hypothetical protein
MRTIFQLKPGLALAALLTVALAQAATMSHTDYRAEKARIGTDYKTDKTACGSLAGNNRDICVESAKAKEKVARAELEFAYTGKQRDQDKLAVAKAESAYDVAKERCDDKAGNDKDVCVKEAKAIKIKALADVKLAKKIDAAQTDADETRRKADYKVAAEKCEALAGEAKSSCLASAKASYGMN